MFYVFTTCHNKHKRHLKLLIYVHLKNYIEISIPFALLKFRDPEISGFILNCLLLYFSVTFWRLLNSKSKFINPAFPNCI